MMSSMIIHKEIFFYQKPGNYQCNATLAITEAIRGSSQNKVYKDLCLQSLKSRSYFKRSHIFYLHNLCCVSCIRDYLKNR